ncbi:methionyl-tRNA formyltransferase [Bacteroidota bacterium]
MKKLRIGYFADGPWSHRAFELLISDKRVEICFIVPRNDTKDSTLLEFSKTYNIDYLFPVNINSDDFFELAKKYNCDLFVSLSFNQIFKERIINLPPLKTINCHAGKLPFYRGRNILNWALINDEKEFGITVHYVDEGIDTGDIILQKVYPISDNDDYGTILNIAFKECAIILHEAIIKLIEGTVIPIKQAEIHPVGFYCGKRVEGDEEVNWHQSSREIFNFIRAVANPAPLASSFYNGKLVKIGKAALVDNAPIFKGKPGQILTKTPRGFLVKTKDSFIEIFDIHCEVKLKVGELLK